MQTSCTLFPSRLINNEMDIYNMYIKTTCTRSIRMRTKMRGLSCVSLYRWIIQSWLGVVFDATTTRSSFVMKWQRQIQRKQNVYACGRVGACVCACGHVNELTTIRDCSSFYFSIFNHAIGRLRGIAAHQLGVYLQSSMLNPMDMLNVRDCSYILNSINFSSEACHSTSINLIFKINKTHKHKKRKERTNGNKN